MIRNAIIIFAIIAAFKFLEDAGVFHQGTPSNSGFTCDGRQYCSEMNSRAEAEFFTRFCPNTKMDGDGDGIPCENDSRW